MTEESTTNNSSKKEEPSFDGYFGCVCGKIRIDVVQPKSSNFVTPTAALCQCTDCYQFASAVAQFRKDHCPESSEKADALTDIHATDMRQIYKSDAVKLAGGEYLQGIKLRENSPCVRYYSTCCGTPLLMEYTMAPFFLVFQHTIANKNRNPAFDRMKPTVVLNHQSAPSYSPPISDGIPVREGVSLGFMSHAIARAIFGLLTGKANSSIAVQLETVPVSVGLGSIATTIREKDQGEEG